MYNTQQELKANACAMTMLIISYRLALLMGDKLGCMDGQHGNLLEICVLLALLIKGRLNLVNRSKFYTRCAAHQAVMTIMFMCPRCLQGNDAVCV